MHAPETLAPETVGLIRLVAASEGTTADRVVVRALRLMSASDFLSSTDPTYIPANKYLWDE